MDHSIHAIRYAQSLQKVNRMIEWINIKVELYNWKKGAVIWKKLRDGYAVYVFGSDIISLYGENVAYELFLDRVRKVDIVLHAITNAQTFEELVKALGLEESIIELNTHSKPRLVNIQF